MSAAPGGRIDLRAHCACLASCVYRMFTFSFTFSRASARVRCLRSLLHHRLTFLPTTDTCGVQTPAPVEALTLAPRDCQRIMHRAPCFAAAFHLYLSCGALCQPAGDQTAAPFTKQRRHLHTHTRMNCSRHQPKAHCRDCVYRSAAPPPPPPPSPLAPLIPRRTPRVETHPPRSSEPAEVGRHR